MIDLGALLGADIQEAKIDEMGRIITRRFPHITMMEAKGSFRIAIRRSLEKLGCSEWKEISEMDAGERQCFFDTILEQMAPLLADLGLTSKETGALIRELRERNSKYLEMNMT